MSPGARTLAKESAALRLDTKSLFGLRRKTSLCVLRTHAFVSFEASGSGSGLSLGPNFVLAGTSTALLALATCKGLLASVGLRASV